MRSMVARKRLAAALVVALAMFVVACGSSDSGSSSSGGGGGGSASTTATGVTKGVAKAPTLDASKGAKGAVTFCTGKDTSGAQVESVKQFNAQVRRPRPDGQAARVPDVGRRAAQPVRPASGGQVRGVRHLLLGCDLDGRVRRAEVAARHVRLRQRAQGRVHPVDAPDDPLRRQVLRRPAGHRRRLHLLSRRQGQERPGDLAGAVRRRQVQGRHRLPGRVLRGPDLRLPRAGLRGRRPGAEPRWQEVRHQLAARTSRPCSSWSTASRAATRPRQ